MQNFYEHLIYGRLFLRIPNPCQTSKIVRFHNFLPHPFVKRRDQEFKRDMSMGGNFFYNSSRGNKKGDSIFYGSSVGLTCIRLVSFSLISCKNNLSRPSLTEHKYSYSCYVLIDHHVIHIFYFLLLFSSTTFSGFHPNFTIHNIDNVRIPLKSKLAKG